MKQPQFDGDALQDEMLEGIESLSGKRRSFSGSEVCLHDEREAEWMVAEGLKVLGLNESQLQKLRKSADKKALLAWLIRRNSVVSNAWIT